MFVLKGLSDLVGRAFLYEVEYKMLHSRRVDHAGNVTKL